ncbi:MAG: metal-sensing transcriptional repressor [Alphaproteobacteria bacterium]|nr:metal-sensing transcriptional repressor [Alphaproteobacteria bacterium]
MTIHQSHPKIRWRLRQAGGHLQKIIAMIDEERPCVDLAQQLHAVEKAIHNAKSTLIQDHINHCLEHAADHERGVDRKSLAEFKAITKYL